MRLPDKQWCPQVATASSRLIVSYIAPVKAHLLFLHCADLTNKIKHVN